MRFVFAASNVLSRHGNDRFRFITGLNNFMSVIMEKAKPHSILIGSMNEIDEAVQKEKVGLHLFIVILFIFFFFCDFCKLIAIEFH